MCWNRHVSLNTFVFSLFVLGMIVYNNRYTPYKISSVQTVYQYLFLLSFISMQLLEYFAWIYLDHPVVNKILSVLISLLLFLQPIASLFLLPKVSLRNALLVGYLVFSVAILLVELASWREKNLLIKVSPSGHLQWKGTQDPMLDNVTVLIWLCFFLFSFFYNREYGTLVFALGLLLASVVGYYRDGSYKSMWCWIVNSVFLFFALQLLIVLPFAECTRT